MPDITERGFSQEIKTEEALKTINHAIKTLSQLWISEASPAEMKLRLIQVDTEEQSDQPTIYAAQGKEKVFLTPIVSCADDQPREFINENQEEYTKKLATYIIDRSCFKLMPPLLPSKNLGDKRGIFQKYIESDEKIHAMDYTNIPAEQDMTSKLRSDLLNLALLKYLIFYQAPKDRIQESEALFDPEDSRLYYTNYDKFAQHTFNGSQDSQRPLSVFEQQICGLVAKIPDEINEKLDSFRKSEECKIVRSLLTQEQFLALDNRIRALEHFITQRQEKTIQDPQIFRKSLMVLLREYNPQIKESATDSLDLENKNFLEEFTLGMLKPGQVAVRLEEVTEVDNTNQDVVLFGDMNSGRTTFLAQLEKKSTRTAPIRVNLTELGDQFFGKQIDKDKFMESLARLIANVLGKRTEAEQAESYQAWLDQYLTSLYKPALLMIDEIDEVVDTPEKIQAIYDFKKKHNLKLVLTTRKRQDLLTDNLPLESTSFRELGDINYTDIEQLIKAPFEKIKDRQKFSTIRYSVQDSFIQAINDACPPSLRTPYAVKFLVQEILQNFFKVSGTKRIGHAFSAQDVTDFMQGKEFIQEGGGKLKISTTSES